MLWEGDVRNGGSRKVCLVRANLHNVDVYVTVTAIAARVTYLRRTCHDRLDRISMFLFISTGFIATGCHERKFWDERLGVQ